MDWWKNRKRTCWIYFQNSKKLSWFPREARLPPFKADIAQSGDYLQANYTVPAFWDKMKEEMCNIPLEFKMSRLGSRDIWTKHTWDTLFEEEKWHRYTPRWGTRNDMPRLPRSYTLKTDASGTDIEAVLEEEKDGKSDPIAFFSRTLKGDTWQASSRLLPL